MTQCGRASPPSRRLASASSTASSSSSGTTSFGPAVTILVAVALLGERLRPIQWVGLAGIAAGLVAIAIS